MNVFVDVDHTMIGEDNSLRPGVVETLEGLLGRGMTVYAWSGDSLRTGTVAEHGLSGYVTDVLRKPTSRYREITDTFGIDIEFVVDDHHQVVRTFGGVCVTPYFGQSDSGATSLATAVLLAVDLHATAGRVNGEFELWAYSESEAGLSTRHYRNNVVIDDADSPRLRPGRHEGGSPCPLTTS